MRLIGEHRGQNGRGAEGERGLLALSVLHGAWTERQLQAKARRVYLAFCVFWKDQVHVCCLSQEPCTRPRGGRYKTGVASLWPLIECSE